MTEQSPDQEGVDDADVGRHHDSPPGMPGWVKVFGVIGILLLLLIGVMMFAGGENHGPGRHIPSGDAGGHPLARPG